MSNCWGIIGGGFSAYGYLPALVEQTNSKVLMLEKHRSLIQSRSDTSRYFGAISFVRDREEIFNNSDSLVLAVPPIVQDDYITNRLNKNYKYLLIEKPVAQNPERAERVLKTAIDFCDSLRIGYIFSNTTWGQNLLKNDAMKPGYQYKISWRFQAHHYKFNLNNWKSNHESGGGVLRFYGIQLIAFLAKIVQIDVIRSIITCNQNNHPYKWSSTLRLNNFINLEINIDTTSSENCFNISSNDRSFKYSFDRTGPFEAEKTIANLDARVQPLKKLIQSFHSDDSAVYKAYYYTNSIWALIEKESTWLID